MKKQSTTKGFAILSAAGMLVRVLSLLYIPVLLWIIKDQGYGIYASAYTIYTFIYVLANSGVPVAISKQVSELIALENYRDAVKTFRLARFMMIIVGAVLSILMMALAYPLANVTSSSNSALAIFALGPTIFFSAIESSYRGYFQGTGNMVPTAVSQIIEQIGNVIFTLVFAALLIRYGVNAGCAGGTIGTVIGAIFSVIYLVIYSRRHKAIRIPKNHQNFDAVRFSSKQLVKKIVRYSVPITVCVGLQYAGDIVDLWNIKSRLASIGYNAVMYNTAYGYLSKYKLLINVPITIISALSAAILPAISGAVALKNHEDTESGINYAFKLCYLISIPSAVGLAVISKPLFMTIFPKYMGGAQLMMWGSIVLVFQSVVLIETTVLQSVGKLYISTIYLILGVISKILVNYIFVGIPGININGAVFGSIAGFLVPLILNAIVIKKTIKVDIKFSHAVKPLISSLLMGISVYILYNDFEFLLGFIRKGYFSNDIAVVLSIFIGILIYAYALVFTGGITKEDMEFMPAKLTKFIPKSLLERIR